MINNFLTLTSFLSQQEFVTELTDDNFYFLQIIQRKKDGHEKDARVIKDFYIKDCDDLLMRETEIIAYCEEFNARAYLNPNVKSYKKCSLDVLKCLAEVITNEQFPATKGLFSSAAGKISTRDTRFEKIWIVDYDNEDNNFNEVDCTLIDLNVILEVLTTKNGFHYLVKPFRLDLCPFANKVQKHNPTLLYYKGE